MDMKDTKLFPCRYSTACLLVLRRIPSIRRHQAVIPCWLKFVNLAQITLLFFFFTRWIQTFGSPTEGFRLPPGALGLYLFMYDIDRSTGFGRIFLVLAVWEHLPKANFHLQDV